MKKFGMFAVVCAASLFVGCGEKPKEPVKTPETATTPAATPAATPEATPATTPAEPAKTEEKK